MPILRWAGRIWTGVLLLVVLALLALGALRLVVPMVAPRPALLATVPAANADAVSTRARATLRFSTPMNRRAVERAVSIDPAVPFTATWDTAQTTLLISPTVALRPDTRYTIRVGAQAASRRFRPLEATTLAFRTLPAPTVLAVLPSNNASEVPLDAALSIHFSRAIVPTATLGLVSALPALRFDPPISGTLRWIDPATALLQPAAPLQPATRYRATLGADVTDLNGEPLANVFAWEFSTPAPTVLATTPSDGAQRVSPRAPLTLRVSPPLDPGALAASLVITPSITGAIAATALPNATQLITFTPSANWQPATTYTAELRAGARARAGDLPLARTVRWFFQVAPPPQLIGRLPGEGQTLAPDQPIRLIFTTPVDADALRAALRFTPPVSATQIVANDTEARITADVRAATAYTITLAPTLADRNGVATGQAYQIRFVTAPAPPALLLPDAQDHLLRVLPSTADIALRRTNLSQLLLGLYQLDETTVVRATAFDEQDWNSFDPARYRLPLVREWTQPLSGTLNLPTDARLALLANDQRLAPGAYYLRIRTPEGPRADVLLLVSRAQLIVQRGSTSGLVWATDVISGTPIGGVPVALYRDGTLIQRGATDASGLWSVAGLDARAQPPYIAITSGDGITVASSTQAPVLANIAPRVQAQLFTDQARYQPGARVLVGGFVRATGQPLPSIGTLTVRPAAATLPIVDLTLLLSNTGALSTSFVLPTDALPGAYVATLAIGDERVSTRFDTQPLAATPLQIAIDVPAASIAGRVTPITLTAALPDGLPLAGVIITWTLSAETLPPPALDGYLVGDQSFVADARAARIGVGQTNGAGQITVAITDTAQLSDTPLRYRLAVRASEPGGALVEQAAAFVVQPAEIVVGARLTAQLARAGQPQTLALLAATPAGQPVPRSAVRVVLLRRTDPRATAGDQRIFERALTTDANGRTDMSFSVRDGGEYYVQISASDAAGRSARTTAPLWVAASGFINWPSSPPDRVALLADQPRYRVGDTATLLPAAPFESASALVVIQQNDTLSATVQTLRAGDLLSTTLRSDVTSARAAVWLVERNAGTRAGTRLATAALPISAARALTATVTADRAAFAPGDTATLTVTTSAPADVVLSAPGIQIVKPRASGVLTFALQLPRAAGALPVQVWAADATGRFGQAQTTLAITRPLALDVVGPLFVRVGDTPEIVARLANTSAVTQSVQVTLTAPGVQPATVRERRVTLAPGTNERIGWNVVVSQTGALSVSVRAQPDRGAAVSAAASLRVISASGADATRSALVTNRFSDTLPLTNDSSALVLTLTPSEQALRRDVARALAAQPDRSVLDNASLLLISAPLTDTRAFASLALAQLSAAQRLDGGWGWWDGAPRDPFITLVALNALAAARGANLDVPTGAVERGLSALSDPTFAASPVLRAARADTRARYGQADAPAPTIIAPALSAETLAYLLAHPASADQQSALLEQLNALVIRDANGAHWAASDDALYRTDISATALVALALQRVRPASPLLPDVQRWLAAQRDAPGWPSAYESALALDALRAQAASGARITATLNGASIFDSATTPITATRQITISSSLRAQHDLVVTTDSAPVFLSYHLVTRPTTNDQRPTQTDSLAQASVTQPATFDGVGIVRDYLDPQTDLPLDPAHLRVGQLVVVRLTLVTHRTLRFATIEEPLLPGALLITVRNGSFTHAAQRDTTLLLARTDLPPGAYQYRYLVRVVMAGSYPTAGATLRVPGDAARVGYANAVTIQR